MSFSSAQALLDDDASSVLSTAASRAAGDVCRICWEPDEGEEPGALDDEHVMLVIKYFHDHGRWPSSILRAGCPPHRHCAGGRVALHCQCTMGLHDRCLMRWLLSDSGRAEPHRCELCTGLLQGALTGARRPSRPPPCCHAVHVPARRDHHLTNAAALPAPALGSVLYALTMPSPCLPCCPQ